MGDKVNSFSPGVRVFLFILIAVCGFSPLARGQQGTAAISGDVTDPQGAAVANATVHIADSATGVSRDTQTDAEGRFQFLSLQPGTYVIRVEATGFRTATADKVEAVVSTTKHFSIKLELGAITDSVVVSEGAVAAVNTTDATIGNAFDSRQILSLPFEGRDAAAVLSLQPGITFIGTNVDDRFDTRNGAVNGGRSDQANITLDGVDNNDQLRGNAFQGALRSTLDSIEEFRVTTAGANADEGRSSGGQVTLVTKSGTNTFHGSLFEQHRPTNMAANDWFNKHNELNAGDPNIRPRLLRNTFGGAIGGPIKKDRLFFFYTYEGQRINESTEVFRSVPSAALRDGVIFYPCADPTQCLGSSAGNANSPVGKSGTSYAVPAGAFGLGPTQIAQMDPNCSAAQPGFPNGTCPQGPGVDPSVLSVLNKYPAPTPGSSACGFFDGFGNIQCNTFSSPTPQRFNTNIAKLDYNLNHSGTHRLFLRGNYQVDHSSNVQEFAGGPPIDVLANTSRALAAGYTAAFSSTLLNNFRYGFTRESNAQQGLADGPLVSFRVFDDLTPNTPTLASHIPLHNWVDDLTWVKGKHTLQFGTNVRLINNVRSSNATSFNTATLNPGGLFAPPAGTGGSLDPAAFGFPGVDLNNPSVYNNSVVSLAGLISEATASYNFTKTGTLIQQGTPIDRHFRAWEDDWYIQDSWRLKSNLTITAGLRYSLLQPPYETTGTQAAPTISLNDLVNQRAAAMEQGLVVNPLISFDLSGQANGKKPYWNDDYKDLGPRLSIAYSPGATEGFWQKVFGGPGKSSIRAGYGIVYDHFGQGIVDSFDQSGTIGLTSQLPSTIGLQTIDGAPRFTSTTAIPTASPDGVLLAPAPTGGFPTTPDFNLTLFNGLGLDDRLKTPYSELVDLAFTRELPGGLVFEAAYVGRFAHRLLNQRDLGMPLDLKDPQSGMDYFTAAKIFAQAANAHTPVANIPNIPFFQNFFPTAVGVNGSTCGDGGPGHGGAPGNGTLANPTATQAMYEAFYCQVGLGTFGESEALFNIDAFCFPACATINNVVTPDAFYLPQYSTLYAWSSFGKSSYNAGQFTLRSKPTHGIQFDFNYTYSKSLDTGSDAERVPVFGGISAAIINTWSPQQTYGPSDFDVRHNINTNWLLDLPFGKGKRFGAGWNRALDTVLGGWQLTGLLRWSSGLPFSVSNAVPGGFGPFPTDFQLPGFATLKGPAPSQGLVTDSNGDPNAFPQGAATAASAFRFDFAGESGQRNVLRGQGFFGTDAGLNKTFRLNERNSIRFSAYAFNLTNSVRFDPNSILNSFAQPSTFGKYTGTLTTSRRLEFALRYQF